MARIAAFSIFVSAALSGCTMPEAPIGVPSDNVGTADGTVVDLARIITEMKCDVREWIQLDKAGRGQRMIVGDVGVELVLSFNRSGDGSVGLEAGIPISPVTIKLSGEVATEAKREAGLTLPFMLYQRPPDGSIPGPETINCADMSSRLPERILPLRALTEQLNRSPSGQPYIGWAGNPEIRGKFYFKRTGKTGFSIVSVPVTLNVSKGSRGIEYIQSFTAYVAVAK